MTIPHRNSLDKEVNPKFCQHWATIHFKSILIISMFFNNLLFMSIYFLYFILYLLATNLLFHFNTIIPRGDHFWSKLPIYVHNSIFHFFTYLQFLNNTKADKFKEEAKQDLGLNGLMNLFMLPWMLQSLLF